MTAQEYLLSKLDELKQPLGLSVPDESELANKIFKIVTTKPFRKYSASQELLESIKNSIELNIKNNEPISFVYPHGIYKLWRLEEAPEADWAELFTFIYYTSWLKGICEIYKPGVWFDFYADDLLIPKINFIGLEEVHKYLHSYQKLLDFLADYRPKNFNMTITPVGSRFKSQEEFYTLLEQDTAKLAKELPNGLPELNEKRIATIELNSNPTEEQKSDPRWKEEVALIHDAYLAYTKRNTNYHNLPNKIRVFTTPLPAGTYLAVGTTKSSIAKFWVGVGALKVKGESFKQVILTPKQIAQSGAHWEELKIDGLDGKNFTKIRVIE